MSTNIEVRNIITGTLILGGNYSEGEIPSGTINGSNVNFSLTNIPTTNREKVFLNGIRLKKTLDYTLSSNIITFVLAPISGDILLADYNY